jgi:hypothetical protein
MRPTIALMILLLSLQAAPIAAADQPTAGSLLPAPAALGPDWSLIGASHSDTMSPSTGFTSMASAMYGGSEGSRIFVRVFVVASGATAVRQARDTANDAFAGLRGLVRERAASGSSSLDTRPGPTGCNDAQRADGQDANFSDFAAGVTLCAVDPDLIILVGVFGSFDGLSGFPASDTVVENIVHGQVAATPAP